MAPGRRVGIPGTCNVLLGIYMTDISRRKIGIKHRNHTMHPNSLANLIPYPKGVNGHQGGYSLAERLKHSLDKPLTKPKEDAPAGDHVVYSTLQGAIGLVPVALRETWDRTEGKVPDKHAFIGEITIRIVEDED